MSDKVLLIYKIINRESGLMTLESGSQTVALISIIHAMNRHFVLIPGTALGIDAMVFTISLSGTLESEEGSYLRTILKRS